jgi:c-di-GMP-binding flagellar brake protein YcgR
MNEENYQGQERRKFLRLDYATPLAYKVCKEETISKILQGYISDISQAGLFCTLKDKVNEGDVLWLSFERRILSFCAELEKWSLIYQSGVVGKVVRVEQKGEDSYGVGVQFITRQEKNLTNIYPKVYFLEKQLKNGNI